MKRLNTSFSTLVALCILLAAPAVHAEIYKWVDENGRTHYSERKPEGGKAPVEMKITSRPQAPASPAPAPAPTSAATPGWQEQERQLRQRQAEEGIAAAERAQRAKEPPRSLSGGREDGTDASRCNLARDILNGSVRYRNGAPFDKNDIDTAKSDVKMFCR